MANPLAPTFHVVTGSDAVPATAAAALQTALQAEIENPQGGDAYQNPGQFTPAVVGSGMSCMVDKAGADIYVFWAIVQTVA